MSIKTEAAELLHAVADLYECGALRWVRPEHSRGDDQMSVVVALRCASLRIAGYDALKRAINAAGSDPSIHLFAWQCQRGRNTHHVIALLRKAAQRLEEACLTYT